MVLELDPHPPGVDVFLKLEEEKVGSYSLPDDRLNFKEGFFEGEKGGKSLRICFFRTFKSQITIIGASRGVHSDQKTGWCMCQEQD